jgi:hypothetical protein
MRRQAATPRRHPPMQQAPRRAGAVRRPLSALLQGAPATGGRRKFVGGPFDGRVYEGDRANVVTVESHPGMAYHRTRPTDTDWRSEIDDDRWRIGKPEPVLPDHVYERHPIEWESPEVAWIKESVALATQRLP